MPISKRTGPPIVFPATQLLSANPNALDDYDEGLWTPVLTFVTPGDLSVAYTTQFGAYTKIGNMVTIHMGIRTSSFTHTTASGVVRFEGLPFTALNNPDLFPQGAISVSGITKATYTDFTSQIGANANHVEIVASGSGVASDNVTAADMPTGGSVVMGMTMNYYTD